jgi:hypothetical protein
VSRRAPAGPPAVQQGIAYTLHFHPPYPADAPEGAQQAGHYTGWAQTRRLAQRLTDHALGRGARLTQVQREAGGSWIVADTEPGTRDRETQLKERGATRRCSVCRAVRDIEAGALTKPEALAKWADASPADRALLRQVFGMDPEPDEPAPLRELVPAPRHEPAAYDPELDGLVDTLTAGWRAEMELEAGA